jgi:hypothetical protein
MTAVAGHALNPSGFNGTEPGKRARRKCQTGLDKAIDLLGKATIDGNGSTRLAELIAEKLEQDVVGTLKALSGLFPKQVNVDVQHSTNPLQLTDDQLLQIIESRKPKVINDIEPEPVLVIDSTSESNLSE